MLGAARALKRGKHIGVPISGHPPSELEGRLPMTRFGVMKHLRVLEEE